MYALLRIHFSIKEMRMKVEDIKPPVDLPPAVISPNTGIAVWPVNKKIDLPICHSCARDG